MTMSKQQEKKAKKLLLLAEKKAANEKEKKEKRSVFSIFHAETIYHFAYTKPTEIVPYRLYLFIDKELGEKHHPLCGCYDCIDWDPPRFDSHYPILRACEEFASQIASGDDGFLTI